MYLLWKDGWKDGSVLHHLNVSSNAPDLVGYASLFWMAGRSRLETFDAEIDLTWEGIHAPTRILSFVLAIPPLQQLDVMVMIFGMGFEEGDVALDSALSMAITNHPSLRVLFLDPNNCRSPPNRPVSAWTGVLTPAITKKNLGCQDQVPIFMLVIQEMT